MYVAILYICNYYNYVYIANKLKIDICKNIYI